MRCLISRTDNIGDVVLSLAMTAVLKKHFGPEIKIVYLTRNYTEAVVRACPNVDDFVSHEYIKSLSETDAIAYLKGLNIDVFIPSYENSDLARLANKAKIPKRLGHLHRTYFLRYCNKFVWPFKRKRCELHQAQMNLQYLKAFKLPWEYSREAITQLIQLQPKHDDSIDTMLDPNEFHLVVHPGNNGNTVSWSKENWSKLISMIPPQVKVYISGSAKEKETYGDLLKIHPNTIDLFGKMPLEKYMYFLSKVNGLVVGSTGPLHLAAALKTPVIGLFPPHQDANVKRWGALSEKAVNIEATPCEHSQKGEFCPDLHGIKPEDVFKTMQEQWHFTH